MDADTREVYGRRSLMRLATVIKRLEKTYEQAKSVEQIKKHISYALYHTWKWADTYEKERKNG